MQLRYLLPGIKKEIIILNLENIFEDFFDQFNNLGLSDPHPLLVL